MQTRPPVPAWMAEQVVTMGLPASRMRFIALSATLPNANDFGSFLGADVFRFGEEFRPVSLKVFRVWGTSLRGLGDSFTHDCVCVSRRCVCVLVSPFGRHEHWLLYCSLVLTRL